MKRFLVLAVLAVAGCDDDSGSTPSDGVLTEAQLRGVVPVMVRSGINWIPSFRTGTTGSGAVAVGVNLDYSLSCPEGGSIFVTGTVTGSIPETGTGTVRVHLEQELVGCGVDVNGRLLTLSTTSILPLLLDGDLAIVFHEPSANQVLTLEGTAQVAPELGPAESCDVNLSIALSVLSGTVEATGMLCDQAVQQIFQLETTP